MRLAMVAALLAFVFSCISCASCDLVEGGRFESRAGEFTVLTNGSTCGPFLSEYGSFARVEKPHDVGGHHIWTSKKTLAGGKVTLDRLSIKWASNKHVIVNCRYSNDALDFKVNQWGDLMVTYTFEE